MYDIVECLRQRAKPLSERQSEWVENNLAIPADGEALDAAEFMLAAADEITRLRSQLAIKDKALREAVIMVKLLTHGHDRQALISEDQKALIIEVLDRASIALTTGGTDGAV